MGSETFVDVTWRGIDVGRRVRLRAVTARAGRLDHGTPMPVGTPLTLITDEGIDIRATVLRVHEQVGGATEAAGMWIAPVGAGDEVAWWHARAEPVVDDAPPFTPPGGLATNAMPVAIPDGVVEAVPEMSDVSNRVTEAMAAVADTGSDAAQLSVIDSANTEVMPAMTEASLAAMDASGPVEERDGGGDDDPSRSDDSAVHSGKKKRGSSRRRKR